MTVSPHSKKNGKADTARLLLEAGLFLIMTILSLQLLNVQDRMSEIEHKLTRIDTKQENVILDQDSYERFREEVRTQLNRIQNRLTAIESR